MEAIEILIMSGSQRQITEAWAWMPRNLFRVWYGWGLMQEKSEERYAMIEVRPEECAYRLCSNITRNMQDMRSMFGYTKLAEASLRRTVWK